jgi:hypothetical protein
MFKRGNKQERVRALVLPLCINQPIFYMLSMVDTVYSTAVTNNVFNQSHVALLLSLSIGRK